MLSKLSNWIYRYSKSWVAIGAALLFFLFCLTILPKESAKAEDYSAGIGTPDTSLYYSQQDLMHMAETYGNEGRQAYVRARFSFDLAFPFVYTFFLVTCISYLLNRTLVGNSTWRLLNLVPLVGLKFDLLENICTAWVIGSYPIQKPALALLAAVFTPLKWLFVCSSFVILAIALVLSLISNRKKERI